MTEAPLDPLALGQRIVAVLETGRRTATYKHATLIALIEHCVEHSLRDPASALAVPLEDIAVRVLELYWHQVRPFDGQVLKQSSQPQERIPRAALQLRTAARIAGSRLPLEVAAARQPVAYRRAVQEVLMCLAQQPLHRLQRVPGTGTHDRASQMFLYDDTYLHDHVSRTVLREHGDSIMLYPGVATQLARLAGLLKPALQLMWTEDVRRLNPSVSQDVPDIGGHLFGRDRVALSVVRAPLMDAFGANCFYCGSTLRTNDPVDHVLPWSMLGIDGLANLVVACQRCNGDKSNVLPTIDIMSRTLARDRGTLAKIGAALDWPVQCSRVTAAARGVFLNHPRGAPTWAGHRVIVPFSLDHLPDWLL